MIPPGVSRAVLFRGSTVAKSKAVAAPAKAGEVLLVHWHEEEAATIAKELKAAGVKKVRLGVPKKMSELRALAPKAILVSLRRLPSHGREVVDALWSTKWGREIPVVFFDGEPGKVEKLKEKFPAARFVTFEDVSKVLPPSRKPSVR
jgi:hypothetical protein